MGVQNVRHQQLWYVPQIVRSGAILSLTFAQGAEIYYKKVEVRPWVLLHVLLWCVCLLLFSPGCASVFYPCFKSIFRFEIKVLRMQEMRLTVFFNFFLLGVCFYEFFSHTEISIVQFSETWLKI